MIIDGHCHAGRGDALTAPWNTDAPLGAYLRRARAAGIDKTVVFSAFHSDYADRERGGRSYRGGEPVAARRFRSRACANGTRDESTVWSAGRCASGVFAGSRCTVIRPL